MYPLDYPLFPIVSFSCRLSFRERDLNLGIAEMWELYHFQELPRLLRMIHINSLFPLPALADCSYFCYKRLAHLFQHSVSACPNSCLGMLPRMALAAWLYHFNLLHNPCIVGPIRIPELVIGEAVPGQLWSNLTGFCWLFRPTVIQPAMHQGFILAFTVIC